MYPRGRIYAMWYVLHTHTHARTSSRKKPDSKNIKNDSENRLVTSNTMMVLRQIDQMEFDEISLRLQNMLHIQRHND